jgi:ubiquinone/menaquinone biosynthesis C-methylase UbiE
MLVPILDLFSGHSNVYAEFRPDYPVELFAYLAGLVPGRRRAADLATGNGQAAVGLAQHFETVLALDASASQLAHARPHPRLAYLQSAAERLPLPAACLDLLTVAQAVHWFDLPAFYAEACRVLRPGGVVALWTYYLVRITPEIDAVVDRYYTQVTGPYWHPRRRWIDDRYRRLPFPFAELPAPEPPLQMRASWKLRHLAGFLSTWSAAQAFQQARGYHPLEDIAAALTAAWGDPETERPAVWPLYFRLGRTP